MNGYLEYISGYMVPILRAYITIGLFLNSSGTTVSNITVG